MFPANANSVKLQKKILSLEGSNLKEKISLWIYPHGRKKLRAAGNHTLDFFCVNDARSITWG